MFKNAFSAKVYSETCQISTIMCFAGIEKQSLKVFCKKTCS